MKIGFQTPDRPDKPHEKGFSLVELVTTAMIVMVIAGMAMIQMQPAWQDHQANAGLDQMKSTLRLARETAVGQRRTILLKFVGTAASSACPPAPGISNCIELFQMVASGNPITITQAANPFLTIPIQSNVYLGTLTGEIDTPDGYGIPAAGGIEFGGVSGGPASGMEFQSDGTFTDGNGSPINGTAFMAINNIKNSPRAVTILGNTGRIRAWKFNGSGWIQQ